MILLTRNLVLAGIKGLYPGCWSRRAFASGFCRITCRCLVLPVLLGTDAILAYPHSPGHECQSWFIAHEQRSQAGDWQGSNARWDHSFIGASVHSLVVTQGLPSS